LHSGIESAQLSLISIALDPNAIASSGGTQLSTIINRVERVKEKQAITGEFLTFPTGTFDTSSPVTYKPTAAVTGAQSMRIVVTNSATGDEWLVYAKQGTDDVVLPGVSAVSSEVISGTPEVLLQVMNTSADYAEMFTLGSAKSLSALANTLESFVIQGCDTNVDPNTGCKIQ